MEQSDSIKNLAAALAQAQAVTSVAKKRSVNPHFKSEYADLTEVWGASREALTAHGLSVLHLPDMVGTSVRGGVENHTLDSKPGFVVQLQHESGEWIRTRIAQMDKPQQYGSFFTYLKRYSLSGIAAVVAEGEDDDGNAASAPKSPAGSGGPRSKAQPPPSAPPPEPASEDDTSLNPADHDSAPGTILDWQGKMITDLMKRAGLTKDKGQKVRQFCDERYNAKKRTDLSASDACKLIQAIKTGEILTWEEDVNY